MTTQYTALLKVDILSATNLRDADGFGKSDPYVKITFPNSKNDAIPVQNKTHFVKDSLNPVWNQQLFFLVTSEFSRFRVEVFDKDSITFDDSLGYANVLRKEEDERAEACEESLVLEKGRGGCLTIRTQECDLRPGLLKLLKSFQPRIKEESRSKSKESCFLLGVRIENATGLKKADLFGKSDPYCTFKFPKEIEDLVVPQDCKTRTLMKTLNPVWDQDFFLIVPSSLKNFDIIIWDWDKASQDDKIGRVRLTLDDLGGILEDVELPVEKKGKMKLKFVKIPIKGLFKKYETSSA